MSEEGATGPPNARKGLEVTTSRSPSCCDVINRYKTEPLFRKNLIRTACLYLALFTLGFSKGQIGPSLLDLQIISGVGLKEGSILLTTFYAGYMGGACVGGAIYGRMRRVFTLTGSNFLLALVTLTIPWCSVYWIMLVVFAFFGLSLGITDSVASGDLQYTWGIDGRPYMQGMQLTYAIGIAVAPLITSPFLSSSAISDIRRNDLNISTCVYNSYESSSDYYMCINSINYTFTNDSTEITNASISVGNESVEPSRLYLAYIFTTSFSVFVCVAFLGFYFRFERRTETTKRQMNIKKFDTRKLPRRLRYIAIAMLVSISGLICCIDDTFLGFLTTFSVKYLNWTKSQGAMLTSGSSFMVVVGRIVALFATQFISPGNLIGIHSLLTLLSFITLYIASVNLSNIGVCIAGLAFGYGKSAILPSIFSWIEEVVSPVTGKIAAVLFFVNTALASVNPVLLGNLMENMTGIWFVLLLLGESSLLFLVYIATAVLSKYITSNYGNTYKTTEQVVEAPLTEHPEV